jgi:hypothetical protein
VWRYATNGQLHASFTGDKRSCGGDGHAIRHAVGDGAPDRDAAADQHAQPNYRAADAHATGNRNAHADANHRRDCDTRTRAADSARAAGHVSLRLPGAQRG